MREVSVDAARRPRHRADGPQRLGQVDAAVDPAGQLPRTGGTGSSPYGGIDPAAEPAGRRRELVGLVPQTAADLLYLESVADECARPPDGGSGECRDAARPAVPGIPDESTRATCRRVSGWRWRWRWCWSPTPPVLLLDEPTRGLDYPAKAELADVLRRLADDGHAVMVATHDVEFAAVAADRGRRARGGRGRRPTARPARCSPRRRRSRPQVTKILGPRLAARRRGAPR